MELQYVRTDKNGTKYYYDWACPRCGGAGKSAEWMFTGYTCYACGGTGKRSVPRIVKEYTEEYAAKLDAKRIAKAKKQAEEAKRYAEEHAEEIEAENRRIIELRYADWGCGKDGVGYVLTGNTYKAKDTIKKNGGKWLMGRWICPVDIKFDGVRSKRIDISGCIGCGSEVWINGTCIDDFIF